MSTYGPYTPVYQAGLLCFVSGQLGIDPASKQPGVGIEEQAHQALKNLQAVLATAGLDLKSVVKTTIFLKK